MLAGGQGCDMLDYLMADSSYNMVAKDGKLLSLNVPLCINAVSSTACGGQTTV